MNRTIRFLAIATISSVLVVAGLASAVGYIDQRVTQVLLSAPNVVRCDRAATITAKVVSIQTGEPVPNQVVQWSLVGSQSSGDGLSATSSITNDQGKTSVRLTFGPVAGAREVRAAVAGGAPTVTVRCRGGLPRTSVVPPPGSGDPPPAAILPPASDPLPATAVRLDRLGIDLPLVEGDDGDVPEGAAVHFPGTAWPGEGGNTYLYAHARPDHFLELWQVKSGDRVELDLADGSVAAYEVSEIHPVVEWDALEYLAPTEDEILTLQTCLTYEETAPRFVVIARPVSGP